MDIEAVGIVLAILTRATINMVEKVCLWQENRVLWTYDRYSIADHVLKVSQLFLGSSAMTPFSPSSSE